jgi:hypothetical protein
VKIWPSFSVLAIISLAGCTQGGLGASGSGLVPLDTEPVVGWSYKLDKDASGLVELFDWPSRSAVVAISSMSWSSEAEGDYLLEVIEVETGEVVDSGFLSKLVPIENDADQYLLESMEDSLGNLFISVNSSEDSHLVSLSQEEFDPVANRSLQEGSSFNLIDGQLTENLVIVLNSEDASAFTVLRDDLSEVRVLEELSDSEVAAAFYSEGIVISDLSSERTAVFEFVRFTTGEDSRPSISLTRDEDYPAPQFFGDLGENYLFGSEGDGDWELLLVSPDSEVLEALTVSAPNYAFGSDFVLIDDEEVFVIQEFREEFSIFVYDSLLEQSAEIVLDRAEEAYFGYRFPEAEALSKAIVLAGDSFALLDTSSQEITRFRALSEPPYYIAGLGFSNNSFLIEDRGELVSYDFELSSSWSFRLLDDEEVIRVGKHVFLLREGDGELFMLTNE